LNDRRWTEEQRLAIEDRAGNLLVSAAAGAGKTAVLVERVVRLITDPERPVGIERLLIVTFTDAAAAEMKGRIRQAIAERLAAAPDDGWLRRQAALVNRASISTMHAFCLRLLRANFHRLGLDPAFRVLDEQEAELLRHEVLDGLFEREYEDGGEDFTGLVDRYGGPRGDEALRDLILRAYEFSQAVPNPEPWLTEAVSRFEPPPGTRLGDLPWAQAALSEVAFVLDQAVTNLRTALELALSPDGPAAYADRLRSELAAVQALAEAVAPRAGGATGAGRDWGRAAAAFAAFPGFESLPPVKARGGPAAARREAARQARTAAKDAVTRLARLYFRRSEEELLDEAREVAPWVAALVRLVGAFSEAYRLAKAGRAQLDFADLEHLALRLLNVADSAGPAGARLLPSDLARELQARYDEVLVDEYQDINGVQEAILQLISRQWGTGRPNLFLVGDVKQSIYRFRLADPGIFLEKYQRFTEEEKRRRGATNDPALRGAGGPAAGRAIDLRANFRSANAVIEAVNEVFRKIMAQPVAELAYDDRAALVGQADFAGHPTPPSAVEVHLIERKGGADEEGVDAAAETTGAEGDRAQADGDGPGEGDAVEGDGEGKEDDLEAVEKEALVVAERLRSMIDGRGAGPEFLILDPDTGAYRPVRFRDVVIILRATRNRANKFLEVLSRHDIPAHAQLGTGYFEATEIETMLAVLRIIDNPRQDIPLFTVLRSPIGGFDEVDLARVRLAEPRRGFYDALARAASGEAAGDLIPADLCRRCADFLGRLNEWRTWARRGGLADLVWRLYRETGYLDFVGGLPGGRQRRANLLALHGRAGQFDRFAVHGLSRFLRFIDRLRETEGDLGTARTVAEDEDVVRIISAHGSKGLEFPVVILADLGHRFNLTDLRADWLFHRELGLAPYFVDPKLRLAYPTLAWMAIRGRRHLETLAEEMRLLYVAMTRARERLILVGSVRGLPAACRNWAAAARQGPLPDHVLAGARSWLDWLGPVIIGHPDARNLMALAGDGDSGTAVGWDVLPAAREAAATGGPDPSAGRCRWEVRLHDVPGGERVTAPAPPPKFGLPWEDLSALDPLPQHLAPDDGGGGEDAEINRRLDWVYPDPISSTLAAKVSASEARMTWAEGPRAGAGEDAPTVEEEAAPLLPATAAPLLPTPGAASSDAVPTLTGRPGGPWRRPIFLMDAAGSGGQLTGAERGSLIHLVVQHLDLASELDESDLRRQLDRMVTALVLTERAASALDLSMLARFWRSELGLRLRARRHRIRREVAFTMAVPARGSSDDAVIVQGIIDCLLEEEDGDTVIDFKTDRIPAELVPEAAEGYRPQLTLYARAAEAIRGRLVGRTLLVFLHPGVVHEVERPPDGWG